jgi:putative ABC transport system substrate-binding protein
LLELLNQIAPAVKRVAVIRNSGVGLGLLGAIQAVGPSFGIEVTPVIARDAGETERSIMVFVRGPNDGLIVTSLMTKNQRDPIIALAARQRLPAVYGQRPFVVDGGLISYGPDRAEPYRLAAGYIDRILKGTNPADLPVQAPTKYETVLNMKTAKALGLDMPASVLVRADEVIE